MNSVCVWMCVWVWVWVGQVCLSLLGTWTGPSWNGATSTLLQVLLCVKGCRLTLAVALPWLSRAQALA